MSTISIEVVYRGIFQKSLAKNICRGIVLAARKENKVGTAFGRYGDSPERNGVPAKNFAVVSDTAEELEASLAKYEPNEVDVSIAVDDTLCKGVESWAWYGLQPINKLLKPNGTLLVTANRTPEDLLKHIHKKEYPYNLAIVKGMASFSGLWVYKDDHTDVRILGALLKICPGLVSFKSLEQAILEEWKNELKVTSARKSYESVSVRKVQPTEGSDEIPFEFEKPGWKEMKEGVAIPGIPLGKEYHSEATGQTGGYKPAVNPYYKKYSARTMRPVVLFDKCIKCTLCWLHCPDSCFDVTPDGHYDVRLESCTGCSICADVCPVDGCITMVNEAFFDDNASEYEAWKKDKTTYVASVTEKIKNPQATLRSHGYRHRGQYQEEIAQEKEASHGSKG
ncbi:4Fe-4S binding protein [Candidatus Acetothermia bacterium]|nr:4Fe-4S binding protein [Candidatus Acetothermia bacterium]